MAALEEMGEEIIGLLQSILDRLDMQAGGGLGGGPSTTAAQTSTAGSRVAQQLTGGSLRSLATRAAGGLALGAAGAVVGTGLSIAQQAAAGGATSFLASGGSAEAGIGGLNRGVSTALDRLGVGQFTGDSQALSISGRAQAEVSGLAERAARAGSPLSGEQINALRDQSTARETRVEDARRAVQTSFDEGFSDLQSRERDKGGDRLASAIESLVSLLQGRQSL